jgi:hypothetical protein
MTTATEECYVYYKIANITNNGYELYYKEPIDINMHKATVMNAKYNYFYKSPYYDTTRNLGTFKCVSKRSSNCRYDDYDYDVFEFSEYDHLACSEKENLYCMGIPETGKNMILIDGLLSQGYPVYYQKNDYNVIY